MLKPTHKPLLLAALSCAGCSSLGGAGSALDSHTWDDACSGTMPEIVQQLAGAAAQDCGFLALQASDKDFYDIMGCARSALADGKAYRFGYQNFDDFFGYCRAAARTPDGQVWFLEFYAPVDEVMNGKTPLQYRFNVKRCSTVSVIKDRRGFFDAQGCTEATDELMKIMPGAA